ncbi:MAG TPA: glycosyltransferase family 2 protein [Candidatus Saccharimonadales bacterium]|nr:glycosyltransferase family 2 protein [Candidatus Saccharimonadales bacterium]
MDRLAVIAVNWNGINDTMLCFESLQKQTFHDFKIVIIDNGSIDSSREVLKKLQKREPEKLTVLYNSHNTGFTGGVNTGIRWALTNDFDYIALLNNDAFADEQWLKNLIMSMRKSDRYGIATGLLLHSDGATIDTTGEQYSKWGLPFPRNRNDTTQSSPQKPEEVFGATGGATLYRSKMLRDIGIFDEDFFAYYEDVDISFRAQLAGWKIYYQPKAVAYHKQGGTSSKMPGFTVYQTFKNLPLVYIKNVPRQLLLSIGIRFYTAYWLMFFKAVLRGSGAPALKGLLESIWYSLKALGKRGAIQRSRKVSIEYIRSIIWPDLPPDQTGLRKLRKFFIGK